MPQVTAARSAAREDQFATYDILFYDPEDSETAGGMFCGGGGSLSNPTLVGNNTTQQIANFFLAQGFTPTQAAGIIGNGVQESGLWPLLLAPAEVTLEYSSGAAVD